MFERLFFDIVEYSLIDVFVIFFSQFELVMFIIGVLLLNEKTSQRFRNFYLFVLMACILFINNLLLIIDQIFYKILHAPLDLSFSEGVELTDFRLFLGSGVSELNFSNSFCFIFMFAGLIFYFKNINDKRKIIFNKQSIVSVSLFIFSSFLLLFFNSDYNIFQYPALRVPLSFFKETTTKVVMKEADLKHEDIKTLIYGSPKYKMNQNKLQSYQRQFQNKNKNIIFIIIESVGSIQIAPEGSFDPKITPNLAKLQNSVTFFKNVYNIFPGTTRSHIPITTGGTSMTWSSVNRELLLRYTGITLPRFFNVENYKTALFSGMNLGFENLNFFYKNIEFNHVFDPDDFDKSFIKKHKVHSWGVDEKIVFSKAIDWMLKDNKPTYLQILTNTTHHPYGVPKSFRSPLPGLTKYDRYLQSIHYTDFRLGKLISMLKKNGKYKDTLIFITGDHGQAFARRHKNNWTHKNYLYEENIKNFLLIIDAHKNEQFSTIDVRASIGDIFPTISNFVRNEKNMTIGRNLFSGNYQQNLIFFHKNSKPELWGLIDGPYKYIAPRMNEGIHELYNLDIDSKELNNIIHKHSEKIPIYIQKIKSWYLKLNNAFTNELKDYNEKPLLNLKDLTLYGPKRIKIGLNLFGEPFKEVKLVHPNENISIFTQGVSYPINTKIRYEFISPSNKKRSFNFKYKKGWSSIKVNHGASKPMELGDWKINLFQKSKKLLSSSFKVSNKARLYLDKFDKTGKINYISFGSRNSDDNFVALNEIHPNEDMEVQLLLSTLPSDRKLKFIWTGPNNNKKTFKFTIKKGWTKSWVYHSPRRPMTEGRWSLQINYQEKELIKKSFIVSQNALLLRPDDY
ncbi:MAG: LTA synthase family protein [Bacteriovoracaceae bacterium]|nr:LTA synthase family protein [Bacteriovoracaceae bacterium]